MAIHHFICDMCGITVEDTTAEHTHHCPECNAIMRWDITGIGMPDGDYEHISDSLAIHPDDIPEHRQKFPNVDILPDGRPKFTSPKQQEKYAEKCGFYKKSQRKRKRGKKIA